MYVIIRAGDTISSLARAYLGSEDNGPAIIEANRLDPPYITDDPNFQRAVAASGTLQFTMTATSGPITVPAGDIEQTTTGPSGEIRSYVTANSVTLQSQGNTVQVTGTCTVPGPLGNVAPYRVTVTTVPGVSVTNVTPMSGGVYYNVLTIGERIFIPDLNSTAATNNPSGRETLSRYDLEGGTGILVTTTGGFLWGVGDLQLQFGGAEIAQEVVSRLRTLRNSLWYNQGSGSLIPSLRGSDSIDVLSQAVVLAESDATQDDRIASATFSVTPYSPGWILLDGTLTLKTGAQQSTQISL